MQTKILINIDTDKEEYTCNIETEIDISGKKTKFIHSERITKHNTHYRELIEQINHVLDTHYTIEKKGNEVEDYILQNEVD